jgi:hypothetical protein
MMHSGTGSGIGRVFAGSPRNRLVQLFVVVAFAPMMLLGGVAYSSAESALCSQLGGQLTTMAHQQAAELSALPRQHKAVTSRFRLSAVE